MTDEMHFSPRNFLRHNAFALIAMTAGIGALFAQADPAAPVDTPPAQPAVTVAKPVGDSPGPAAATPATGGASMPMGMGAANGDYMLRAGDTIEMIIYREPDLTIRSRIGKDGMVQLPLLGEIKLGGLTIRNATTLIRNKYNADYLVEPQIYLNISAYNTRKFTIIGQVGRPGSYEFGGGEELGLLEAIGMAGGFTRIADRGHVLIKRRDGDTIKSIKVNAKKLADVGVDQCVIQAGDVINVGESWY
jgi:polysaccharide export outer membrane protein